MLLIIATPIGNLKDITLRALEALKEADLILCEDTRQTQKLLNHYNMKKPLASLHQHSNLKKIESILNELGRGKNVALVTDAGAPGISDPGGILVKAVLERFGEKIKIASIPGASALTALASISGIAMDKFIFMGFPPHKKGRETFFKEIVNAKYPIIFYESVHRIKKALEQIAKIAPTKKIIVGRELTKQFETVYRGTARDIFERLTPEQQRGEFVAIIEN